MLWVGVGVAGSAYAFVWSLQPVTNSVWGDFIWAGEPAVLSNAAGLGAIAWFLLTIPVLIAGLVRLFSTEAGRRYPGGPVGRCVDSGCSSDVPGRVFGRILPASDLSMRALG